MILNFLILIVGFAILIKGADWLVDGASGLARRYGVSELAIGLTVVAFGTSMPELVVSLFSSADGLNGIVYGNVIGSNIFNLLFILGIAGAIFPLAVQSQTVYKEIPFSLFATILMLVLVNDTLLFGSDVNLLSRFDGLILLVFFGVFLVYIFRTMKQGMPTLENTTVDRNAPVGKMSLFIALGLVGLIGGGKLVVDAAVSIAESFGMSEKLIGLTIIAAGTSLPELATSAVAAYKKNSDIAVGNIVGSNIFNILFILGASVMITPAVYPVELNIDMALLLVATVILFITMFTGKIHKLDRWEAVLMFAAYAGYVAYLFYRN